MSNTTIDWPQILDDMAFLLGDEDRTQPGGRVRIGTRSLAASLGVDRELVRNWLEGREPKYGQGDMLLRRWVVLTGKALEFAPRTRAVYSAAGMRERA